jgi:nicotinamide-nucleotide amidase
MPGVPYEMKQMFEEFILPQIEKQAGKNGGMLVIRKLNCFGAGESKIAEMLSDIADRKRNPQINYTVNYGVVTVHITARANTIKEATKLADVDAELIGKRLGNLVCSSGGQTLAEVVGRLLTAGNKTLAIAESCTGGLLGSMVTDIPGASRYFTHGWITYSNNAKITELGVPAELIEKYGAVSEEVASAMANQAKKRAITSYAIAITGIAGPDGGTVQKPAGLVFISIAGPAGVETKRFVFTGDRTAIRIRASNIALNTLRLKLQID